MNVFSSLIKSTTDVVEDGNPQLVNPSPSHNSKRKRQYKKRLGRKRKSKRKSKKWGKNQPPTSPLVCHQKHPSLLLRHLIHLLHLALTLTQHYLQYQFQLQLHCRHNLLFQTLSLHQFPMALKG